jgi:hypothetical protein
VFQKIIAENKTFSLEKKRSEGEMRTAFKYLKAVLWKKV